MSNNLTNAHVVVIGGSSGHPQSRPVGVPEGVAWGRSATTTSFARTTDWLHLSEELYMITGTKWKTATLSAAMIVLAVMDTAPPAVWAQASTPYAQIKAEAASSAITVKPLRGSVTVLEGSGGNIAILSGAEGLLMVDAGIAVSAAKLETALQGIASSPIKYVINTHWPWDHPHANAWVHPKAATIIPPPNPP